MSMCACVYTHDRSERLQQIARVEYKHVRRPTRTPRRNASTCRVRANPLSDYYVTNWALVMNNMCGGDDAPTSKTTRRIEYT